MSDVVAELVALIPDAVILTDPDSTEAYRFDQARFCEAGKPLAVIKPTSTAEVVAVMKVASAHGVPVVPQGGQSGLSGGANAIDGCFVLNFTMMNRILEINEIEQTVTVEPGVFNMGLSHAVLEKGLFYPPDPSSWDIATIGGNLATNAGGLCCVKYGVTTDYVRALEVVLSSGEVLNTGRVTAKGVAGYDLTSLMVGSEGTLGVITKAVLRLVPAPFAPLTAVGVFPTTTDAMNAVADIMAGPVRPSMLEFMDSNTIQAVNAYRNMGFPEDAGALLLAQSDRGELAPVDLEGFGAIFTQHHAIEVAISTDREESEMLMEARRLVHWAMDALGATMVEDVAVPRANMADLVNGVGAIAKARGLKIPCHGHAGDGNLHPTVVFERGNQESEAKAVAAFGEVMELALSLGGTITGEHGVGRLKKPWLAGQLGPEAMELNRRIKAALDPDGILNPGAVI